MAIAFQIVNEKQKIISSSLLYFWIPLLLLMICYLNNFAAVINFQELSGD